MTLRLVTLGRCVVATRSRSIDPAAELLFAGALFLGLERGFSFNRETLAALFWPDADHTKQGARFRWLLNRLRALGVPVEADATHVTLPAAAVSADYLAADQLELNAIGPVLPGYNPTFSAPYARWLDERRESICTETLRQLLPRLLTASRADDWQRAADVAEAIQRVDPLNEEAMLTLAEAQCRLGAKARAIAGLDEYIASLGDDSPELRLPAEVLRRRVSAERLPQSAAEPKFVGRADALQRIGAVLSGARRGSGGALVVAGAAGVGKTRLLAECIARTAASKLQVISVRCRASDVRRPLAGLIDLIPALIALRGAVGAEPANYTRLAQLGALVNDDIEVDHTSPELARARLAAALIDVLDAATSEVPVVILIDDVQWSDQSLTWIWDLLIEWAQSHPLALLFGFRRFGGEQPAFRAPVLNLSPLGAAAASALIDELLPKGKAALSPTMRKVILDRGSGNPLYLREIVRHWSVSGSIDTLPVTLVSLLESALARLSPAALRAVQVASILGSMATLERIERVLQMPRPAFLDAMIELDAAGILVTAATGELTGHMLWSEVTLLGMSGSITQLLHRHAAECLDAELSSSASPSVLWESVRHWEAAGQVRRMCDAMVRGAEHLTREGFPEAAAEAYGRLATSSTTPVEQLRFLRHEIELLFTAGRLRELTSKIDGYEQLASVTLPSYDRHNELEIMRMWIAHLQDGATDAVLQAALACARDAHATSAHRLRAAKEAARIAALVDPPHLHELRELMGDLPIATSEDRWNRDRVEFEFQFAVGDVARAAAVAEASLAMAREWSHKRYVAAALALCAIAYTVMGRFADARFSLRETIDLASESGLADLMTTPYDDLIGISLDTEPYERTRALIAEARRPVALLASCGATASSGLFRNHEAQLALQEGRPRDAVRLVEPLEDALRCSASRWRARFLAIHLGARMQLDEGDELDRITERLASCFDRPGHWLDWPAVIFAEYLERYRGSRAAAEFAHRFVSTIRRELYAPPQRLIELAAAMPWEDRHSRQLGRGPLRIVALSG